MLNNFKYFKYTRRLGFKIINSPKVAFVAITFFKKKRWNVFSRPLKTQTNLFWVSKYFSTNRVNKVIDFISFFKRKKRRSFSYFMNKALDFCLYSVRFFKTMRHARFFIKRGIVLVNDCIVSKPDYRLKQGDIVCLKWISSSSITNLWVLSYFFSNFKKTKTFSELTSRFEISYSSRSFCLAFLFFGQLVQRKNISFTQKML